MSPAQTCCRRRRHLPLGHKERDTGYAGEAHTQWHSKRVTLLR